MNPDPRSPYSAEVLSNLFLQTMIILLIVPFTTQCSFQMKNLTTVRQSAPTAKDCGKCHAAIYEEWAASSHAHAWTSRTFRDETADHRITDCLPCHAPETVFVGNGPITKRNYLPDEGVTCLSCHLREGAQHGPLPGGKYPPHAVSGPDPLFRDSKMCGVCHKETYESWKHARETQPDVQTCQECHMAPVKRKMTSAASIWGKPFVAMEREREMRRHSFEAESANLSAPPVRFELRATSQGLELVVSNNLPHLIPTGDYGYHQARLTVEQISSDGDNPHDATIAHGRSTTTTLSRDLYPDLGTALPADTPMAFPLPRQPKPIQELRIRLEILNQAGQVTKISAQATLQPPREGTE